MALKGRRTLAQLEKQFAALNAQRERLIEDIKAAVRHMVGSGAGADAGSRRINKIVAPAAARTRRFSPAARAKLRAAAKRRWAEAKKAGRARL